MNYGIIFYTVGWVLNIEAVCMLLPLICSVLYKEQLTFMYVICILVCLVFGFALTFKSPKNKTMFAREGFVTVAFSWIALSLFGTIPFILSGYIPSFADAFFETVSGFTTTGASILKDVEALPHSLLLWRSFTHWIGGMGVLVFLVALMPLFGGRNMHFLRAESTGASVSKLVPKVRSSALILYGIYSGLTVLEIILLYLGDIPLFDAVTLAFGTAGTGGFSIKNSSVAQYSAYVQNVITIFMIIFGVDFSVYFLILMRKFNSSFRSEEVRGYFAIILISILIICVDCRGLYESFGQNLTHSAFQVASIMTTTGYSTVDFDKWNELSKTVLLFLMFIGACAGSTGGGIKVSRIIILVKSVFKEIKLCAHPNTVYKVKMTGRFVEHETMRAVNVFAISYIVIFFVSLFLISFDNFNFTTNFSAIAATINNIGPGFDLVGPTRNFSVYSSFSKLVMCFDMLVGRLEVFPMLMLFFPQTWRK